MSFMGLNRQKTPRSTPSRATVKPGTYAALDIGTTKVTCFIGRSEVGKMGGTMPVRVIGIGHHPSDGMRAGPVVDMEQAEQAIRSAVDAAERMAGTTLRHVVINLSAGAPKSKVLNVEVDTRGREITEQDLSSGFVHGRATFEKDDQKIIHSVPIGFSVDGSRGVRDPIGMYGDQLGIDMNVITAAPGPIRNLIACVERCHLEVSRLVVSPYASGLACLVEDELDLGVTCVDMGGGTTSIAVFAEGALQFASVVPVGGEAVTKDIAQGLSTPFEHAERMKTLYGSALGGMGDVKELIRVPQVGDEGDENHTTIPKAMLTKIIRPRVEETLEHVRDRLTSSGFGEVGGRRMVLTGGGSQLTGIRELATRVLDKQVRLGQPIKLTGLADATRGPAFSTCAGLLAYESSPPPEALGLSVKATKFDSGRGFQFVRNLFRENV